MAALMGTKAIDLLCEGKSNRVVIVRNGKIDDVDIDEGLNMKKTVSDYDYNLVSSLSRGVWNS